ncbi:MAG: hypothetical protein ACRDHG_12015, partial [Anaerolineales bacterium]
DLERQKFVQEMKRSAEDPLWKERAMGDIQAGRQMGIEAYKAALQRQSEGERRQSFSSAVQQEQSDLQDTLQTVDRMPVDDEKKEQFRQRYIGMYEEALQNLRDSYGLGARMTAGAFYGR